MSGSLLSRDALVRQRGGLGDYISPTRLNLWLACPEKFRLKYVEGIETFPSGAAFVGRAVHRGLERFYRHRQLGVALAEADLIEQLGSDWSPAVAQEKVAFASTAEEQACQQQTVALLQAYLRQLPRDEPVPLGVEVAVEAPLVDPETGEDLGIPLVGVMDLVLPAAAGPTIVDFKTTARSSEPLAVVHEIQLTAYSYLFRRHSEASEGALEIRQLVKTKRPQVVSHRYGSREAWHLRRLFTVIRAYLDDLQARRFMIRPSWSCVSCDFRRRCSNNTEPCTT